ncbi:hypothetical protein D3C72_2028210 [compost metagenome]
MLLQSHQNYVELLPALPVEWKMGAVKGFVARGNFVVDMTWKDGKLTGATILSRKGGSCKLMYDGKIKEMNTVANKSYTVKFD